MVYKIKISLKEIVINLIEQIFSLKTYIRILILVLLDIFIINISLLISSVLLSVENIYYFSYCLCSRVWHMLMIVNGTMRYLAQPSIQNI